MNRIQKVSILIGICVVIACSYVFMLNSSISSPGELITEKKLVNDLMKLGKNELQVQHAQILLVKNATQEFPQVPEESRYLEIVAESHEVWENPIPNVEVRQSFRVWLHVIERKLPFDIVEVRTVFRVRGTVGNQIAKISKPQFMEMVRKIPGDNLSNEEKVTLLTEMWLSHNKK